MVEDNRTGDQADISSPQSDTVRSFKRAVNRLAGHRLRQESVADYLVRTDDGREQVASVSATREGVLRRVSAARYTLRDRGPAQFEGSSEIFPATSIVWQHIDGRTTTEINSDRLTRDIGTTDIPQRPSTATGQAFLDSLIDKITGRFLGVTIPTDSDFGTATDQLKGIRRFRDRLHDGMGDLKTRAELRAARRVR